MNRKTRTVSILATGTLMTLAMIGAGLPASASTNSSFAANKDQCEATPARTVHHAEVSHTERVVVPGTKEVSHLQQRWGREIPAVTHEETQFYRVIKGEEEISYKRWMYSKFIPGNEEIAYNLHQFKRHNPGQQQITEQQYKYKKVTQSSYQEHKLKKTATLYVVEHKKVKVPYGGYDRSNTLDWLSSIGATDLGGDWWQLPDSVVAAAGVNPFNVAQSGNVNLGAYGGPGVTVQYQITGIETYDQPPAGSFVELKNQTLYYTGGIPSTNPGNAVWTRDIPAGWNAYETRTQNDPEVVEWYNGGEWTNEQLGDPWIKTDERTHEVQTYIAPFLEYRAQDGSATTDANSAGKFKESTFDGWTLYNTEWFVEQEETENQTLYLTRDTEGNLVFTANKEDAGWFTAADEIDATGLSEFNRELFIEQEATPDKLVYLTQTAEGVIGETEDPTKATWVLPNNPNVDLTIWTQMVNDHGDPLLQTVTDEPGYKEYFVLDGEPTRELGETNWTDEDKAPEEGGWSFIDERKFVDVKEVPDTIISALVIDRLAYDEEIAAKDNGCTLAQTGGPDNVGPASLALGLLAAGGALAGGAYIKRRRENAQLS